MDTERTVCRFFHRGKMPSTTLYHMQTYTQYHIFFPLSTAAANGIAENEKEREKTDHKESSVTRAPDNGIKNEPRRVFVYLQSYVNI